MQQTTNFKVNRISNVYKG